MIRQHPIYLIRNLFVPNQCRCKQFTVEGISLESWALLDSCCMFCGFLGYNMVNSRPEPLGSLNQALGELVRVAEQVVSSSNILPRSHKQGG